MKIVMTLLAWNEADIIDAHLAFHLNAGVDFVIAMDNGSDDGTTEILESYARDGYVDLTREAGDLQQADWQTCMARRAADELGADWVINSDADEFYWPRGGTLKDVLSAVPARYGGVRGMLRNFAPRPHGDDFFAERMTVRVCNPGAEDNSPYSPRFKAMHRGDPQVKVLPGSNRVLGRGLEPIPGWYPIDVLHFPTRSLEHFTQKYLRWWALAPSRFRTAVYDAHREGRMREFYESYVIGDEELAKGVANGTLAIDTRLRDAMRSLRAQPPRPLTFFDGAVDSAYLSELALLEAGEPHAHVHRKAEDLEARLAAIEQSGIKALMRRRPRRRSSAANSRRASELDGASHMITRHVQALGRDVHLRPGTTDEQVFHETFVKQFHVPPEEIRPATVLDLGCNIGLTVAHFEQLWPNAEIIGVDLDSENCVVARRNCRRARILNVAVSATSGRQTYSGEEAWSLRLDPSGNRAVEARTLDELTDLFGGSADFVKMDIEGAEWEVVKAPGEWPERVGSLLIEIHGNEGRRQAGIAEMMGYLRDKGFTCRKHEAHWSAVWAKRERSKGSLDART